MMPAVSVENVPSCTRFSTNIKCSHFLQTTEKHVVFIAQRRILPKPTRKANKLKQKRPISRTLVAVHTAILDDLVYPAEIVGKRTRIRLDGSRLYKIHLDKNQQTNIEHKVSRAYLICLRHSSVQGGPIQSRFDKRLFGSFLELVDRSPGNERIVMFGVIERCEKIPQSSVCHATFKTFPPNFTIQPYEIACTVAIQPR